MKLVGVRVGDYEGNKWAHAFFEYSPKDPYAGVCISTKKMRYDYALEVIRDWPSYDGMECDPSFDESKRIKKLD